MRLQSLALAFTFLSLAAPPAPAQVAARDDGKVLEQARFELPTFEQVPDRFRQLYGRKAIELAVRNYRRSLGLNPQNTNATAALKRIGQ
jgi:hypothetical protein